MLVQAQSSTAATAAAVQAQATRIEGMATGLQGFARETVGALGAIAAVTGGLTIGKQAVQMAAEAERLQVSFEVLMGSAAAASKMLGDLQRFSAVTPLRMPTLTDATKTLLQMGFAANEVVPMLRMMGDAAGGDAEHLLTMATVMARVRSEGHMTRREWIQLVHAGFNPLETIAKATGKTVEQLGVDMEQGGITAKMLAQAFADATGEGGRFHGMMAKQAQTVLGLWSTAMDSVAQLMKLVGREMIDALRLPDIIRAVTAAAQAVTGWLKSASPEMRRLVGVAGVVSMALLGVAGAAATLTLLAPVLTPIVTALTFLAGIPLGPLVGGIVAVAAGATLVYVGVRAWVEAMGGADKAWAGIRATAASAWSVILAGVRQVGAFLAPIGSAIRDLFVVAWREAVDVMGEAQKLASELWAEFGQDAKDAAEFLQPVLDALGSLAQESLRDAVAALKVLVQFVGAAAKFSIGTIRDLKNAAVAAWRVISMTAGVDWNAVRDTIRDVVLYAEYGLNRLGSAWETTWVAAGYGLIRLQGEFSYFFGEVLPALGRFFLSGWQATFQAAYDFAKSGVRTLADMLLALLKGDVAEATRLGLMKAVTGTADLQAALGRLKLGAPEIKGRVIGEDEARALKAYEDRVGALGMTFAEFKTQKLKEFEANKLLPPELQPKAGEEAGDDWWKEFWKGWQQPAADAKHGIEKWQGALFGSAEAYSRRIEHSARLNTPAVMQLREQAEAAARAIEQARVERARAQPTPSAIAPYVLPVPGPAPSAAAPQVAAASDEIEALLRRIAEAVEKRPLDAGIQLAPGGLS